MDSTPSTPTSVNQHSKKRNSSRRPKKLAPLEDVPQLSKINTTLSKTKTIQRKKDLVDAVRKVAPASVQLSPALFHDISSNLKTSNIDDADVRMQLSIVEDGVNGAARRYNDLKVLNDRRATELKIKLDELEGLKLENDSMIKMKTRDTPEAEKIDQLKINICQIEDDIEKSLHYYRQLDHMLTRLHKNQIKFGAHMNGMEDSRNAIQKEYDEVRLLRRSLDSGLSHAQLVYDDTLQRVCTARRERENLLNIRKGELKNAHRLKMWMRDRQVTKAALATELRGDLTKEEEGLLRTQLKEKEEKTKRLQRANEESQRRVSQMDETFMRIKQITGVSSLDDMVDKFLAQKVNKKNLEKEISDVELKLHDARKANLKLEQTFQDKKSSGVGEAELNREGASSVEEKILLAKHDQKISKASSERLHSVLIALRQGAHGLMQRVQGYLSLVDTGVFELTSTGIAGANMNGDEVDISAETMDSLGAAEQVLSKMLEIIGGADPSPNKVNGEYDSHSAPTHEESSILTEAPSMTNNVRIRSRRTRLESENDDKPAPVLKTVDHSYGFGRNDLESYSSDDDSLDSTSIGIMAMAPQKVFEETNNAQSGTPKHADISNDDDLLSRSNVKKVSTRVTVDAEKKAQQDQRIKKITEKMVTGGEADESGLANMAKYKAQQATLGRLCAHHHPATLPETVTIRDDPMTKTSAFLTCMPKLE